MPCVSQDNSLSAHTLHLVLLNSRLCDCYEVLSKTAVHSAKTGEDFGENSGSKSARTTKLWQFWQNHPKPAFSKKGQRGDQRKFFKNRPKGTPRLKIQ